LETGEKLYITVFGGSGPKPGSPGYIEAYELGKLLGAAGHTVLTGGYIGTMEAVSKGAAETGGHVVGVTCDEIENWRKVTKNAWVQEERRFQTLEQRLNELVHACDAAIALSGGPGTLTEIALSWNLMIVDAMPRKPLILIGERWKKVLETFNREFADYTSINQGMIITFAATIHEASELVSR
jgi:uncharacterized protein (TIGR00725 family)